MSMKTGRELEPATPQEQGQAALLLRLIAQAEADVAAGRTVPQDRVFRSLRKRLLLSPSHLARRAGR